MHKKPLTFIELQIWMIETGRTDVEFAAELSGIIGKPIHARTVGRWRKGISLPRTAAVFAAIDRLSHGRITANTFVRSARERPDAEPDLSDFPAELAFA